MCKVWGGGEGATTGCCWRQGTELPPGPHTYISTLWSRDSSGQPHSVSAPTHLSQVKTNKWQFYWRDRCFDISGRMGIDEAILLPQSRLLCYFDCHLWDIFMIRVFVGKSNVKLKLKKLCSLEFKRFYRKLTMNKKWLNDNNRTSWSKIWQQLITVQNCFFPCVYGNYNMMNVGRPLSINLSLFQNKTDPYSTRRF